MARPKADPWQLGKHRAALAEMFANNPPDEGAIEACQTWLRMFAAPASSPSLNTYLGKHLVEKASDFQEMHRYIGEPSFIVAALREGYQIEVTQSGNVRYPLVKAAISPQRWREALRDLDRITDGKMNEYPRPDFATAQRAAWVEYWKGVQE